MGCFAIADICQSYLVLLIFVGIHHGIWILSMNMGGGFRTFLHDMLHIDKSSALFEPFLHFASMYLEDLEMEKR